MYDKVPCFGVIIVYYNDNVMTETYFTYAHVGKNKQTKHKIHFTGQYNIQRFVSFSTYHKLV